MANGDITAIKELGRSALPGSGRTTTGTSVNQKIMTWGEITATYVSTGLALGTKGGVRAFGVSTADYLEFETRLVAGVDPASDLGFLANWASLENKIYICDEVGISDPTVPADGDAVRLRWFCIGDGIAAPELS